jgi:hypothetical protein
MSLRASPFARSAQLETAPVWNELHEVVSDHVRDCPLTRA